METQGVIEMLLRSIKKNGLRCTSFVGDEDSNCYALVCQGLKNAPKCHSYEVKMKECVGYIQQCIGTTLREYKRKMKGIRLADGKSVSGKGRLTNVMINRIQKYFGQCIRNNKGNLQGMQNDILTIFKHMIQDDSISLADQHANCRKYGDCKYWANNLNLDTPKRLPFVFFDALKPKFTSLTNADILQICLKMFTQNQNDSINDTVWKRCPKTRYCGQQGVQVALCEALCHFNAGSGSVTELLFSLGLDLLGNTYRSLHQKDKRRLHEAAQKIS